MVTHNLLGISLEAAIFLLFCVGLAAGTLGGVIRGWSVLSRLYSAEDRLAVVEGTLLREVKTRAGLERGKNLNKDVHQVDAQILKQAAQTPPAAPAPFWTNPMHLPRAYDGK